jgi:formyl-CoA transferase
VVDLSRLVAGNILTLQLADFGAEVIKIEPPEGDTLRSWKVKGVETAWKVYSRNKKSVALDLRSDAGRTIVRELAASAQILVESFRPGVLEDMGLAPAELHKLNPKLVIVRISGWGQDGRFRHKPGFGTLIEGYSGFASMNGFGDREPVLPPMYLADAMAALYGYGAVMVALREIEVNRGTGQTLDLPLFDPLFSVLGPQAANYKLTGEVKARTGSRSTNAAPRNVYETKDGHWVCLSASTQGMAMRVLTKIGRPELTTDPRFSTNIERVKNGIELDAIIGGFIKQRDLASNLKFFDEAGVTIGPVYDIAQIVADDYVLEREALIEIPDAEMGELPTHPVVPRMSGTPGALKSAAPKVGEHNEALLKPLLGEAEYNKLKQAGVIR